MDHAMLRSTRCRSQNMDHGPALARQEHCQMQVGLLAHPGGYYLGGVSAVRTLREGIKKFVAARRLTNSIL